MAVDGHFEEPIIATRIDTLSKAETAINIDKTSLQAFGYEITYTSKSGLPSRYLHVSPISFNSKRDTLTVKKKKKRKEALHENPKQRYPIIHFYYLHHT